MTRIVEHWHNGQRGADRRVAQLQIGDDGRWQVYAAAPRGEWVLVYSDEASARDELALLLEEHGPWRRLG